MNLGYGFDFPAPLALFLAIYHSGVSTVALTIPTSFSIAPVTSFQNDSSILPALNASSLHASNNKPECTLDSTWYNEDSLVLWRYDASCGDALRLFQKERDRYSDSSFEFLAPGAQPTTQLGVMQTPRRYTAGKTPI